VAKIDKVLSCSRQEKLSTVKTLNFETLLDGDVERVNDTDAYVVEYDEDYYDVAKVKKALSGGQYRISFDCEHISYRLTDASNTLIDFTVTGSPRVILTALLSGTDFHVGEVEPNESATFSIASETTRRAAILQYCAEMGYDADFRDYFVHVYLHRGSSVVKELVDRNVVSVSKTTAKADNSRSYTCTIRSGSGFDLGDEVHFYFPKLGIDENVRIVGMSSQPFTSKDVGLEVDDYAPTIESQFARIETSMVAKGKNYYGVKITADDGLNIARADGTANVQLNADEFAMQAVDGEGRMQNRIYFDPATGDYKFVGNVSINGGEINIGDNFRVDQQGNAYLAGDATIYGGKYYAGRPEDAEGFSQMTADGFVVYNGQTDVKLRFGYTSDGEDFPFVQLGSGSGVAADYGLIKKFSDGLWIGNSDPANARGEFVAKAGYNGMFFKFADNTAYIVHDANMRNIYTGAAIAKFG
jgi:hypothetical protein